MLGGCGTKADYRWNQGVARSCLPQVSSQIRPRLAFVSSFPPIDDRLPLQRLVCVCAWIPVRPRCGPHSLGVFQRRQQRVLQVLVVYRAPSIPRSWLRIRCRSCRSWLCRLRRRWVTWMCLLGCFS